MKKQILTLFAVFFLVAEVLAAPPRILTQPQSRIVPKGTAGSVSVVVENPGTVTYQWLFDGTPVTGGTATSLNFSSITVFDAGKYEVIVHNADGATRSSPAYITVSEYQIVKDFSFQSDGGSAQAELIQDADGQIYGATFEGFLNGDSFGGALFRLDEGGENYVRLNQYRGGVHTKSALIPHGNQFYFIGVGFGAIHVVDKTGANERILTSFESNDSPVGLMMADNGYLYASAESLGGFPFGKIFRIDPSTGNKTAIHEFEDSSFSVKDGQKPAGSLVQGFDGGLYGVTRDGGANGGGTLFRMNLDGSGFRVLHAFAGTFEPTGGVVQDSDGTLFGVSKTGGTSNKGIIYKVKADGSGFTVLHNFSGSNETGPFEGLTFGPEGSLFGVTTYGGKGTGIVYQYSPSGQYQVLYSFRGFDEAPDAQFPSAKLLAAADGTLYGVTTSGGANFGGVIYRILLHQAPRPPRFTKQPLDQKVRSGDTLRFFAEVTGGESMSYQWFFNGTLLQGAASAELSLPNVQVANAGQYYLVVSNSFGAATSWVAKAAIREARPGRLVGWGRNFEGQIPFAENETPPLTNIIAIAASTNNTLAVRADGTVLSWGQISPPPAAATNVVEVAVGDYHSLALRADGTLVAWGDNSHVQINVPQEATNIVAIAAHMDFCAALRADGRLFAWGEYWDFFQYDSINLQDAEPYLGNGLSVAANYLLRNDGVVVDWFNYPYVIGVSNFVSIANGVGVQSDSTVAVWDFALQQPPAGLSNVLSVARGLKHMLALREDGSVVGWGASNFGQTNIPPGLSAWQIAAGGAHGLAIVPPDSVLPGVLQLAGPPRLNAMETQGSIQFVVERLAGSDGAVSVKYQTIDGTATAGEDYSETAGTLNFASGQTHATITVPLLDDFVEERAENFTIVLSEAGGGAALGMRTMNNIELRGDESVISLEKAEYSIHETTASLKVRVLRSGNTNGAVGISIATAPWSATAGSDYTHATATFNWAHGEMGAKELTIPILGDLIHEGDEPFYVSLSNLTGVAKLGIDTGIAWIIDDESPPVIEIAEANYEFDEHSGFAVIKVLRRGGSTIYGATMRTINGTALVNQDFEAPDDSITFLKDEGFKIIRLPIFDSYAIEGDETFEFEILNPTGGASLGAIRKSTITIRDGGHSPEDISGHRLLISDVVVVSKNDPGQFFSIDVHIFNPGPARSGPGFLHVAPLHLFSNDTNELRFNFIEPGGTAVVNVNGFQDEFGLVYATVYETIDIGNVAQDSRAIYEFFNTAPPTGGVPVGDTTTAPGFPIPPKLARVSLIGPDQVIGGQTASYSAAAVFDNNLTNQNVTAVWKTTLGTISSAGVLTTQPVTTDTALTITATMTICADTKSATKVATILAPPKTNPVLSWNPPLAITYGTALGATQLNATADVPGTFSYNPPIGTILNAGTHTLRASFTPQNSSVYNGGEVTVSISVTKATPVIAWNNPAAIVYGTVLSGAQLNASAAPTGGTFSYSPEAGTTLNAGSHALSVTYIPADTGNYNSAQKFVTIEVSKANPVITWNNPADIVYGTPLSATQLNATATPIGGALRYTPGAGAILNAGSRSISVTYTPADTNNYSTVQKSVLINIAKATPIVAWNNPGGIVFGSALSGAELNATATPTGGTFAYDPAVGSVLNAGTQVLNAIYTPANTDNYNLATQSVSIVVSKANPAVTWNNPADIVYGTPLSAIQQNATATPAGGSLRYTPAAGTILNSGNRSISVTYTPPDTNNFNTVQKTVFINVSKAPQTLSFDLPTFALLQRSLAVNAQASSGLPVTYSVSGPGNLSNGTLTFSDVGAVTVSAAQAGNDNYSAAASISKTLSVVDVGRVHLKLAGRIISWPDDGGLFVLETSSVVPSGNWVAPPGAAQTVGGERRYTIQSSAQPQYFRLRNP